MGDAKPIIQQIIESPRFQDNVNKLRRAGQLTGETLNIIRDLRKLPKRRITISELLECSEMRDLQMWLKEAATEGAIGGIIIIGDSKGKIRWRTTPMMKSRLCYLLDFVKTLELLNLEGELDTEED